MFNVLIVGTNASPLSTQADTRAEAVRWVARVAYAARHGDTWYRYITPASPVFIFNDAGAGWDGAVPMQATTVESLVDEMEE